MRVLITGADGFIGRNLVEALKIAGYEEIDFYTSESDNKQLEEYCKEAEFVFHLAGVNRPGDQTEFMDVNYGLTVRLLGALKSNHNHCPIMFASSTQAELGNPYGRSKKAAEDELFEYNLETGARVLVYRFANVFGKWCRPDYNSVVATFCYNTTRGLPIEINSPETELELIYIDDLMKEMLKALVGKEHRSGDFCYVPVTHNVTLGQIADMISGFRNSRQNLTVPDLADSLGSKLYSTYVSYLPEEAFNYPLVKNSDERGSFAEFLKLESKGQVAVNVTEPKKVRGNHWHHSKSEKFLVVSGQAIIRFRRVGSDKVIEYRVSDDKLEVIDIPTGYTHNIENIGIEKLVTIMWASEPYDPENPDTYYLEV